MKTLLYILACLLPALSVSENCMAVSGTVTDINGNPIEGASVVFRNIVYQNQVFETETSADGSFSIDFITGIDTIEPEVFTLGQNYPNPFNPGTTIPFTVSRSGRISLDIFNVLGQKVRSLIDSSLESGAHKAVWDGTNDSGDKVSAGVYLYRLSDGESAGTGKMLLLDGGMSYEPVRRTASPFTGSAKKEADGIDYKVCSLSITKDGFIPYGNPGLKIYETDSFDITLTGIFERSGFLPGAVFREYLWKGPWRNASFWQRVTEPNATNPGAKEFLPNPVNKITIDDLDLATGAEVYIELLQCHAGTTGKKIRLNENEWLDIPEADAIPGGAPYVFQTMTYPSVKIPLDQLQEGINTFELTNEGARQYMVGWGQFIIYGVTFRIFYSEDKAHPSGTVVSPSVGSSIGENPTVSAIVEGEGIRQVDFIGLYEDFNYEGDNIWRQWHYTYRYGKISQHIGTATDAPYEVEWNTDWLPDQDKAVKIMARIVDGTGLCYLTEAVENVEFRRNNSSVVLYKPYQVPQRWVSRAGTRKSCKLDIGEDLGNAIDAKLILVNWAGTYAQEIGINGTKIAGSIGRSYDLSYNEIPLPLEYLVQGVNIPYTYSDTSGHGIEVNWPGIAVKIRYKR